MCVLHAVYSVDDSLTVAARSKMCRLVEACNQYSFLLLSGLGLLRSIHVHILMLGNSKVFPP